MQDIYDAEYVRLTNRIAELEAALDAQIGKWIEDLNTANKRGAVLEQKLSLLQHQYDAMKVSAEAAARIADDLQTKLAAREAQVKELQVENESLRDGWEALPVLRNELAETKDFLKDVANACESAEKQLSARDEALKVAREALKVSESILTVLSSSVARDASVQCEEALAKIEELTGL